MNAQKAQEATSFELAVAEIFRDLGAVNVKHNQKVDDSQIDVTGEIATLGHRLRLIVECKSFSGNLPLSEVEETINKFRSIELGKQFGTMFFLVSATPLTAQGYAKCQRVGVFASTFDELERQLVSASEHIRRWCGEYERSGFFVDQRYQPLFVEIVAMGQRSQDETPFDEYVDNWINDTNASPILLVLGDYGDGKSTSLRRACWKAAAKYMQGESDRAPLLFYLKYFQATSDLPKFILTTLIEHWSVYVRNYRAIERANEKGHLLLLFDGFDEMDPGLGRLNIVRNLKQFESVATQTAKIIISCRNTYFAADSEIESIVQKTNLHTYLRDQQIDIVRLQTFSEEALLSYLRTHGRVSDTLVAEIQKNAALLSFIRKPVIAEFVTQYIDAKDIASIRFPVQVYDYCLKRWLDRDDWKSRLIADKRYDFCMWLADHMREKALQRFSYPDLHDLVRRRFEEYTVETAEIYTSDVMNCTFFTRSADGAFSFYHKSILEYLVALRLFKAIDGLWTETRGSIGKEDAKYCRNASVEVIEFVEQMIRFKIHRHEITPGRADQLREILGALVKHSSDARYDLRRQVLSTPSDYLQEIGKILRKETSRSDTSPGD